MKLSDFNQLEKHKNYLLQKFPNKKIFVGVIARNVSKEVIGYARKNNFFVFEINNVLIERSKPREINRNTTKNRGLNY